MSKILLGLPCREEVKTPFAISLFNLSSTPSFMMTYIISSCIHDARNNLAARAINNNFDRLVMIDSDMVFDKDLIARLNSDMDIGIDYVSALCFGRHYPSYPCVFNKLDIVDDDKSVIAAAYSDYPKDQLFECAGTGCAATMISVDLLKRVWDSYGPPFFPIPHMGEDLSFCWRARQLSAKLYCDSRIKVGHFGSFCYGEDTYLNKDTI